MKFRKMYRLDVDSSYLLLNTIGQDLQIDDNTKPGNCAGSDVSPKIRLAITLQYLAGGSVRDIKSNFEISMTKFYRSVWCVVNAINNMYSNNLVMKNVERSQEMECGFAAKLRQQAIPGSIAALNSCLIWQKEP